MGRATAVNLRSKSFFEVSVTEKNTVLGYWLLPYFFSAIACGLNELGPLRVVKQLHRQPRVFAKSALNVLDNAADTEAQMGETGKDFRVNSAVLFIYYFFSYYFPFFEITLM